MSEHSHGFEPYTNWKEQAKALFLIEHISINDIAVIVKKSRETISRFLSSCEEYENEMLFRKKQSEENRREYQRQWDRSHRRYNAVTTDSIKNEHISAVKILSAEKFYG